MVGKWLNKLDLLPAPECAECLQGDAQGGGARREWAESGDVVARR